MFSSQSMKKHNSSSVIYIQEHNEWERETSADNTRQSEFFQTISVHLLNALHWNHLFFSLSEGGHEIAQ